MFNYIKPFIKANSFRLVFGIILLLAIDALTLITPWVLGAMIDALNNLSLTPGALLSYFFLLLGIELIVFFLRFFMRNFINKASYDIEYKIRTSYFNHLLTLDAEFFGENKTGDLMARATNDILAVRTMFTEGIIMVVDSIFIIIAILFITMSSIDLNLTLVSIINLPIMAIFMMIGSPILVKRFKASNVSFGKLSEKTREFFSGSRLLKAFNKEDVISDVFRKESFVLYKNNIKIFQILVTLNPFIRVIAFSSTIIALFYGGNLVLNSKISIGMFVTFIAYLQQLTWPFMAIGFLMSILQMGLTSLKRICEIMETFSKIDDKKADFGIKKLFGKITVKNLSFVYPNNTIPSIKHISFEIKKGQTLGIIGKTGSGKTTLAQLLLRRYDVDDNSILIDDIPIKKIPSDVLRNNISCTFQDSLLFSDSIKNNIAIKDISTPQNIIEKYAKISEIDLDIKEMENGYDTILGEKGVNISGGQKQRISLARTLISNPNIIILDDAISAVDNKTQRSILDNLKTELKNKTAIIISHRISTIQHSDKIIVMDNGFIVQEGTHESLIKEGGLYKDFYMIQNEENNSEEIKQYE